MDTLSELLTAFMARAQIGSRRLSKQTGIPRSSIDNWRAGTAQRPNTWQPLLHIARVLALSPLEVDALLTAAGYPSLDTLAHDQSIGDPDWRYLQPWLMTPMQEVPSTNPPCHQLRAPTADFVGRTEAISALLRALHIPSTNRAIAPICGVRGMGGIGKTELAYLVATRLTEVYVDAQIVMNLRGMSATPLTPEQALQQVIRTFAPHTPLPEDPDALCQHYCATLHGKRVLILAEDARDAAQVRPLMPPPGCALLITSRQRFALPGMTTLDLEQLADAEAVTLLCAICPRLHEDEAQVIAHACGNLPLALRVSGSILQNTPALPIADYIQRLAQERQRLSQLHDPEDAALDVGSALALSYIQLDPDTQQIFRQLGVFAGDFTADLAEAVVEKPQEVDVTMTLHGLLRRNLLMYDSRRGQWQLHDLVRELARQKLEQMGGWATTMWRYAHAIAQVAQEIEEQYLVGGDGVLVSLARFDAERTHIDAARHWAEVHLESLEGDELFLALTLATYSSGRLRYNHRHERLPWLQQALAATKRLGDRSSQERICNWLGETYWALGDATQAAGYCRESLTLAQTLGNRRLEGRALNNLGTVSSEFGDLWQANDYYHQALVIARELGDRASEGRALHNLGSTAEELGKLQQAVAYLHQALIIARELGDRALEGSVLESGGCVFAKFGDHLQANDYYHQALAIARELGDQHLEGYILCGQGTILLPGDERRQVLIVGERALDIAREIDDRRMEGYALTLLGQAYTIIDDHIRAIEAFEQALDIFDSIQDRLGIAKCCWHYGCSLALQGDLHGALPLLRTTVVYEHKIGHAQAAEHKALLIRLEAGDSVPTDVLHPLGCRAGGKHAPAPTSASSGPTRIQDENLHTGLTHSCAK